MDVSKHLEKAAEAVKKKNFDYAVSLYHQVLVIKPDHGDARRELRDALVRRSEYKKVPKAIAMLQSLPSRLALIVGKLTRNKNQVIQAAEKCLKDAPRNPGLNKTLAEALESAGHPRSAVAVWEFLGEDSFLGDFALKRAGALYYQLRQMEKALGCYEAVLRRTPRDSEAEKMRKNLAAEGVLSSGSYDPTRSSRDLARDKDKKQALETAQKLVAGEDERTAQTRRLEQAVAADPSAKRARRDLVEHFVKGRQYAEAIGALEAGIALDADAFDLKERLGDVRVLDFERQLRDLEARAQKGDAAAATDLVDVRREKLAFELAEYGRRVKEHPTDLDLRFRLGRLLLESGDVDLAIENLQHAVKDPRRRIDSQIGLGTAFERKGMFDLARRQLETALESVEPQSERSTEIRYTLAGLLEKSGDAAAARACFETIYERDIHYKDVATRLAALRQTASAKPAPAPKAPTSTPSAPPGPDASTTTYDFKD